MKYTFLVKNFRSLSMELQIILVTHVSTLLFCFFPWVYIVPYDFLQTEYWHSAFGGASVLMGSVVFLFSFLAIIFFADKLFETKKIHLPFPESHFFMAIGIQQLILLFLITSVLVFGGKEIGETELRFGIFICILAQIVGVVATYLETQNKRKKKAQSFFQHPHTKHTDPKKHDN